MRYFSFLLFLFFALFSAPLAVNASADTAEQTEPVYAVAENSVWFYGNEDEASGLFILPRTYYVKVVSRGDPFSKVEYGEDILPFCKISGYCRTSDLQFVDFVPERPYLYKQVTLNCPLKDAFGNEFDSVDKTFLFYGTYFRGTECCWYVYSGNRFLYITQNGEPEYTLNTDYLKSEGEPNVPTSGTGDPSPERSGLSAVQIVLICVAVGAVALLSVFVLFGKKPPFRRENDSEF